ncbi:hypothetical protein EF514_01220 [Anaerosphaera multitolerans]|jgi:hypothetical protein|uniref:Uncharacterized protein n=2 Tax=Anaerosphaera multitolerans TaxID=2487351 RepID=A0A437SAH5_9FIRM|nr:hypothetical protein EF514_01220 [Anaerosphaera multitolerans]
MMISPETYYDHNLKGKSASEILSKIRGLKNEIGRLKNLMESPGYNQIIHYYPSYETQLWCNRLYLEKAKQALADMGEKYKPSKQEQKVEAFDASVRFIEKIVFSIGGYFGGYEERTLAFQGDNVSMTVRPSLYALEDHFEVVNVPHSKNEFLDTLTSLHIGEWKASYDNPYVSDGTQWKLEIYFSNGHKKVKKVGSNAYPYNFNALCDLIGIQDDTEGGEE